MELITFLHITIESAFAMLCIIAAIHMYLYTHGSSKAAKVMISGLRVSAVINIADALAYFYRGNTSGAGYYIVRISNFVVFLGMFALLAVGSLLLDRSLEEKGGGSDKRLRNAAYALSAAGAAVLVLSRLTGSIYTIDENNVYHRGSGYLILPLIAAAGIAVLQPTR